jgi:hypothetical protein
MRGVCAKPYAQYKSNVQKTIYTIENTTKSRSYITNTFHNVVEKRNPYQSKNQLRRPDPTPASLLCTLYNISYVKDSDGSVLVSAHASTVYAA